jgi:hypothetical protein
MFGGLLMVALFTPVPLEHLFHYVNPEVDFFFFSHLCFSDDAYHQGIHPFLILSLILGTLTIVLWLTASRNVVYPLLWFVLAIYSSQIVCFASIAAFPKC